MYNKFLSVFRVTSRTHKTTRSTKVHTGIKRSFKTRSIPNALVYSFPLYNSFFVFSFFFYNNFFLEHPKNHERIDKVDIF